MAEAEVAVGAVEAMGSSEHSPQASEQSSNGSGKTMHHIPGVESHKDTATKTPPKPTSSSPTAPAVPTFPPPKTDKPRPHVCTTCMRSFARLEHLKRHERSHTKEKPFECPSCTRCFARRDLLLRHQQKLHSTTTPSSRPRNARRESAAGVASGRVRKNSVATTTTPTMRPRANTLSHIDTSSLGLMSSGAYGRQFMPVHNHHNSFSGMAVNPNFGFRGIGTPSHPAAAGLPRLETASLSNDLSGGLRTAPPFGGFGAEFDISNPAFDISNGNTINPHALHMHSVQGFPADSTFDFMHTMHSTVGASQTVLEDDSFEWMAHGFENQMAFAHANENAIDDSSPSMMSMNSPTGFTENATQTTNSVFMESGSSMMPSMWQPAVTNASHVVNSPMSMDMSSFFGDVTQPTTETISPKSLVAHKGSTFEMSFPTPPEISAMDPAAIAAMSGPSFTLPFKHEHIASTASSASVDSSLRQSSVTTNSSELVSDHMRNVLIASLSQNAGFGQRKQSQPTVSSPLSPTVGSQNRSFSAGMFPSTHDLQRYVSAYIKYFHPHLPFLHIATLNFESSEYSMARSLSNNPSQFTPGVAAGGSCLMLSVAALGALFEDEMTHSRDLFDCGKRLISTYLEDRRRHNMNRKSFAPYQRSQREDTPLWLVQAMLLNVIYGHNCGDKTAADIASNHCAALVSLARGAELAKPYHMYSTSDSTMDGTNLPPAHHSAISPEGWNTLGMDMSDGDWYEWKIMEERKRTLYAIFILSSLLVTAYNRAPALTNSEIRLALPCDEELWDAPSAQAWRALGGSSASESRSVQFATALTHLLTAAQRQRDAANHQSNGQGWQSEEPELKSSSFGCLILINALHNYIWETRQRHLGRQWTPQEIDSMHAHIEPALRAWQTTWHSNPTHTIERPNPFGAGPLSADSIPLLDLAYVRLFVDFGRSKEAYWQRDYDAMAEELAKGSENSASPKHHFVGGLQSPPLEPGKGSAEGQNFLPIDQIVQDQQNNQDSTNHSGSHPTQRERHLRKAAFYAADHLIASDRLGSGLDEQNARELPMQSILCACDSAQVLAEWAATVQERVGKYVGVIGRDDIDFVQVPSILLLDDEDRKLLSTIEELLRSVESKQEVNTAHIEARQGGYGSRILIVTSQIMTQAAVWPVTKLMARSLEIQAGHIKARALASIQATPASV